MLYCGQLNGSSTANNNITTSFSSLVMDVDYAPSGREFVSAGYDKCLRIFQVDKSRSK